MEHQVNTMSHGTSMLAHDDTLNIRAGEQHVDTLTCAQAIAVAHMVSRGGNKLEVIKDYTALANVDLWTAKHTIDGVIRFCDIGTEHFR